MDTLPRLRRERHQVIHADAHRGNLLAVSGEPEQVAGIIDFGDMVFAPMVMEVAVGMNTVGVSAGS